MAIPGGGDHPMGMTLAPDLGPLRQLAINALEAEVIAVLNGAVRAFDHVVQLLAHPAGSASSTARELGVGAPFAEELNQRTVAMLGMRGASPDDLRRVAALLHVTACAERIVARCAKLAGQAPGLASALAQDDRIRRMSELEVLATRRRLVMARDAVTAATTLTAPGAPAVAQPDEGRGRALLAVAAAAQADDRRGRPVESAIVRLANLLDQINLEAAYIGEEAMSVTVGLFTEMA